LKKNTHIIVFINLFTKYTEAFIISKINTETVAEIYIKEIICKYKVPNKLLSDKSCILSEISLQGFAKD
jgi:hypothetical protein